MLFHGLDDLFQLMILYGDLPGGKLREVKVTFAIVHMVGHPPCYGLHIGVPGVTGGVAMAVVAGFVEDDADVLGHVILCSDVIRAVAAEVFGRAEELDDDEDREEGEEDFGAQFH